MARLLKFQIKEVEGLCYLYNKNKGADYRAADLLLCFTKVLISCAITGQLICAFVFTSAKSRFSHEAAHMCLHVFHTTVNDRKMKFILN